MKRILYYITALLIFGSCEIFITENEGAPDTTPQTTLMYMTGTDLTYFFNNNITVAKQAIAAGGLGYGRFLVFRHSSSNSGSLVEYSLQNNECVATTLVEYTDITSLTQDAIVQVIADTKEWAPADSYNLIVSGHATGWVPKERTTGTWDAPASSGVASHQSSVVDWEAMSTSPVVTRYLGSTNDRFFDIDELKESLDMSQTHFNCIIFDECFMSSIEALYDLRNNCNYIIASPCEIMGDGFPYDTVIPKIFANKGREIDLQGICQEFFDYYDSYAYPSGCVALTVTSELEPLAAIVAQINAIYGDEEIDLSHIQVYERLEENIFYDLEHYTLTLCATDSLLSTQFLEQMALAFPTDSRLHTDRFFANIGISASSANNYDAYYTTITYYSGITTSAPSGQMATEWSETAWSIATRQN